jgi:hypothetical protein
MQQAIKVASQDMEVNNTTNVAHIGALDLFLLTLLSQFWVMDCM